MLEQEVTEKPEVRKIQSIHGEKTFVLCLPKEFIARLKISRGDYVKCRVSDNQLIVEKAEI
jgi:hypothetical protein